MALSLGIVGLPNVGKSTLFNALTNNSVPAENYPFCTIDPNIGRVPVVDSRLDNLEKLEKSKKKIYTYVDFVDIAGLVKGASEGQGLGNKFLTEIQNVDAIVEVVRVFENKDILHVNNAINPKEDISTIETELILKDIEVLKKFKDNYEKLSRTDPKALEVFNYLNELNTYLQSGKSAKEFMKLKKDEIISENIQSVLKQIPLLTNKPMLYVANISEDQIQNIDVEKLKNDMGLTTSDIVIPLCIKLEYELSTLNIEDKIEFLKQYGLNASGLEKLVLNAYSILGLISFFTTGIDESRAWTVVKGSNARQAAQKIHSDFYDKFIAAEVVSYEDFINANGYKGARENGKLRLESKDYIVKDGDIIEFRHGA